MNIFKRIIVNCWLALGQVIGLIFIDSDKNGKFYCIKYYGVYSFVISVLLIIIHPIAYYKCARIVNVIDGLDHSIPVIVTSLRDSIDYIFMIAAFIFQRFNRMNLMNLLNEISEFVRDNERKFSSAFSLWTEKIKYENIFCVGIVLTFMKASISSLLCALIINKDEVNWIHFLFLILPKAAMFVVVNEYFYGVLLLRFHISMYTKLISEAQKKLELQTDEKLTKLKNDLDTCDLLDEMSLFHSKLFKIYKNFSGMYQFQMLLFIFSNFFGIMLDMFYVFNVIFYAYLNLYSPNASYLKFAATFSFLIRCFTVYFHLAFSCSTTGTDAKNQKLVPSMNSYRSDRRLKHSVIILKLKLIDF
ncbi:CLUMA_CG018517, isoform A [Clunio marinus]|uniref:Gustatory receptor n=1 Tax=Clunio marinus TaxID=568069 RepID=A0A1J1IZH6_9DIPT|nr:CLUMA_CG018517, isoform A [Clunio marinus]